MSFKKVNKKSINIINNIEDIKESNISQSEIDKLIGIVQTDNKYQSINKNEWKNCVYCEKFHHKDYFIQGMDYCVHCWGWLNCHEYDIELGFYGGVCSIEDIHKTIKKVYPIHNESNCKNDECIFTKIKKYSELKQLHKSLIELLELNKKQQQIAVCFNYRNKNLNIDFDESYIVV
jgi:hypothetical protein